MPVWTKLKDGRYMVVFEVVDLRLTVLNNAQIYCKTSPDGVTWEPGLGKEILEKPVKGGDAKWVGYVTITEGKTFESAGKDARNLYPGRFGAQYVRMAKMKNGDWIVVYTVYENNGYLADPKGGTTLEIEISRDNCRTWKVISKIAEPGRDLDNGQIKVLKNGDLLLACRSVAGVL